MKGLKSPTWKFMSHYKTLLCSLLFISISLVVEAQLVADFAVSDSVACGNLQVNFFDQSSLSEGNIVEWEWDLGGTFSAKQNPGIIFTDPGVFTVCLTVKDNKGNSDTKCKEKIIKIYALPQPDFEIDKNTGCSPTSITFTDLSNSETPIEKWIWDIGGTANVMTIDDPTIKTVTTTYESEGTYSASLTVEDGNGCLNTIQKKDIIVIDEGAELDIDYEFISNCEFPWEVQFKNLSVDPDVTYAWDFGNGEQFIGAFPPIVNYDEKGTFDVVLTLQKGDCESVIILEDYIDTDRDHKIELLSSTNCVGTNVVFSDGSPVIADSVLWDFGDGNFSSEANPSHIYSVPGCYNILLSRYINGCRDVVSLDQCVNIQAAANIDYHIENQFACGLPTMVSLINDAPGRGSFTWIVDDGKEITEYQGDTVNINVDRYGNYDLDIVFLDDTGCEYFVTDQVFEVARYSVNLPRLGFGGCAPRSFTMVDSLRSTVPIQNYSWNVYDNQDKSLIYSSTEKSPTFSFADTGRYDVQLIAENIYGCIDTVYRNDYIQLGNPPQVDFDAQPIESCVTDTKLFFDRSDNTVNGWFWRFGDETTSKQQNPTKKYSKDGKYDVALTAFHNGCPSIEIKTDYITINQPKSVFNVSYDCADPFTVEIRNLTQGADSLVWTINLGDRDTIIYDSLLPPLTFPGRGKYAIQHYAYNDSTGCENVLVDTIRIVQAEANLMIDTLQGCAPFLPKITDLSKDAERYQFIGEGAKIKRDTFFNPTYRYNNAGTFNGPSLIVTDIHECKDTFNINENIIVNGILAKAAFNPILCTPAILSPRSISRDTFAEITSYLWSVNDGSLTSTDEKPNFMIDSAGVYSISLTVKDDQNCTMTQTYPEAVEAIEINPDFTADTVSCTWAPIRFRAVGVSENIDSILWDFGNGITSNDKNPNYIYESEGVYSICLSLSDKRGCTTTICKEDFVKITNPIADFTGDPLTANCPPLLSEFTNLSQNALKYTWDFGDETGSSRNENPSKVFTEPGDFNITLVAELTAQCRDTIVKNNFIKLEGPKGSFTQVTDSMCLPLTVTLEAESDDDYLYIWDFGNGEIDTVNTLTSSNITNYQYDVVGAYVPKIIIVDEAGCNRAIAGERIFVNDISPSFMVEENQFCGAPADISLLNQSTSSSDNVTYQWLIEGPENLSSEEVQPALQLTEYGTYTISLISKAENCIDTFQMDDYIEVSPIPTADFEIENEQLCSSINVEFRNTTTVENDFPLIYTWDFGDGGISSDLNPMYMYDSVQAYEVRLTVTTDIGCMDEVIKMIPVQPSTIADAGVSDTICLGDQIALEGNVENLIEGASFYWEENEFLSCTDCLNPMIAPDITQDFVLVAVHPNGCLSIDTVTITVKQIEGPELELEVDSMICLGDSALIRVVNYDPNSFYFWGDPSGTLSCQFNCEKVYANTQDDSEYYIRVSNEFGCYADDTISIMVEKSIGEILPPDRAICLGNTTDLIVEAGSVISWSSGGNMLCEMDCDTLEVNPDARQNFTAEVMSELGCIYFDTIAVNVFSQLDVSVSNDSVVCVGEEIELVGLGFGMPMWIVDGDTVSTGSNEVNVIATENKVVYYNNALDECSIMDSIILTVYDKAEIEGIGDTICPEELTTIQARPILYEDFYWVGNQIDSYNGVKEIEVQPGATTTYFAIAKFRSCEEDTAYVEVYVHPEVAFNIRPTFTKFSNKKLFLEVDFPLDSNYSFNWAPDLYLNCVDCPDPEVIDMEESQVYLLEVTDENTGCLAEQEVFVRYKSECSENVFFIPNAFSPNNDGHNDKWEIKAEDLDEFRSLSIYDRWGNRVFVTDDINAGWDGHFNGKGLLSGVFIYRINAFCEATNQEYQIFGDITLIR